MTEIIGLIIGTTAVVLGLVNWKLFICREINQHGTSAVPLVAVVLFAIAGLLSDFFLFRDYFWSVLIIDGAAAPMLVYVGFKTYIIGKREA